MTYDATGVLLNRTDLDSANDGAGSGTDATVNGGAVLDVGGGGEVGIVCHLRVADATAASTTETLDIAVDVSRDGTNFGTVLSFRRVTASELSQIPNADGGVRFTMGARFWLPLAETGDEVKVRLTTTASSTNQWAPFIHLCDPNEVRDEWIAAALGELV